MPFVTAEAAVLKSYDYIVIGGGTAGLTAAVRLSENPSESVLVLEAGSANLGDPKIDIPGQFGCTLGDPKYDWRFSTVKQRHVNDREIMWSRGKGLGGSSTINFYAWTRPPAKDVDAIERLGNPGWNWDDFVKYSKKSETFRSPLPEVTDKYPHSVDLRNRGSSGPVQVTIAPHFHTLDRVFQQTMRNIGLNSQHDPYGGDINGSWMATANLDPDTWTRCSSVSAYLLPNINRGNLFVLTQALVSRVLFQPARTGQDRTISGVEFLCGGRIYRIKADREVVLCAGAVKSPQILELSGVGNPAVLANLGVKMQVALPGVGENLQEHLMNTLGPYELDPRTSHETLDLLKDPKYAANARALYSRGMGIYRNSLSSFVYFPLQKVNPRASAAVVKRAEREIDLQVRQGTLAPGQLEQLSLQVAALRDDTIPDCEIILWPGSTPGAPTTPGKRYISFGSYLNHPISRGSIHAISTDPTKSPMIDPHHLESDVDLEILVQNFKFSRRIMEVEPLKSNVIREILPGPACQTDSQIRGKVDEYSWNGFQIMINIYWNAEYLKNNVSNGGHAVGTCSMLPRSKNGVVNPRLKVYGITNLRVADLSVIPIHIATHPQTIAYVIGEKVADFLKDGT
ncbi:Dehydrogenase [Psilocybe cubensis]|uniref:Dehydrogenase n=2 Tax=Psilocybe cubensis TaxID=181762 RepID=A0ACB8GZX4_PSICU|nr:Dehydrogenase [Psilocybe cubensis]KAH9481035.1 Dehydrogenase [Psilocybe cubensis]